MIKIEHDFDLFAAEFKILTEKQFKAVFKRSITRSLKKGRASARRNLGKRMHPTKGTSWTRYFNNKTILSRIKGDYDKFEGYVQFSSKQHGLRSFTTEKKLMSHRKAANKHNYGKPLKSGKARSRFAKPLIFDLYKGKKTMLKRTFAATGNDASGKLQVFRPRSTDKNSKSKGKSSTAKFSRPLGPSIAQAMRSRRNRFVVMAMRMDMNVTYNKEFRNAFKHHIKRMNRKVNSRRTK